MFQNIDSNAKRTFVAGLTLLLCVLRAGGHEFMGGLQTFEIGDGEDFCFYQEFPEEAKWNFGFRVVRGGNHDIDVEVKNDKTKAVLYQGTKQQFADKELGFEKGLYSICFSNKMSVVSHKHVFMMLTPVHPEPLEVEAGGTVVPKAKTLMESLLGDIHEALTDLTESQNMHKALVYDGMYVAYELNSFVNFMSIGVMVAIMVTGFGQVYLLKRLFDTPRSSTIKPATSVFVSPM